METSVTKDELYTLVKQAIREVIKEERIESFLNNIPRVSSEEMADIEQTLGTTPSKKLEIASSETFDI